MTRNVVLIDGKNTCYRAHFTRQHLSSFGRPTSVISGFLSIMLTITRRMPDTPMIMVWEGGGKTWRHELLSARSKRRREEIVEAKASEEAKSTAMSEFNERTSSKGYKGNRKRVTSDRVLIEQQIPVLREFLQSIGFRNVSVPKIEADDMIGLLSHTLPHQTRTEKVIIYSTDRDFNQLISKEVLLWRPAKGERTPTFVTPKLVMEEYGVYPADWTKMRAITGDKSDNIPQMLRGVGSKTAVKMLLDGLDPSQEKFSNLPANVKLKYKAVEKIWPDLHENYQLCKIIRKMNSSRLVGETKDMVWKFLKNVDNGYIRRDAEKTTERSFKNMINFLLGYELAEILENKRELWRIP